MREINYSEKNSRTAPPTDPELMQRIADGDETAFEIIMRRHEDKVFRLAIRILGGNIEEARDVSQEVFIRLWENPRAWKPTALFTTWLYRVTTNRALNRRRAMKLKSFFSLSEMKDEELPTASEADSPVQTSEKNEDMNRFEIEFNRLPPRQRSALHLRYREEMPVVEVADALGVSVKSAESLLFRAKKTLREKLTGG